MTRPGDALTFTIDTRALVYAPASRKVVRFDPPRLVAACPMPACEWYCTAPDSTAGLALAETARRQHALTVHPEAVQAGGLVLPATPLEEQVEQVTVRPAVHDPDRSWLPLERETTR